MSNLQNSVSKIDLSYVVEMDMNCALGQVADLIQAYNCLGP